MSQGSTNLVSVIHVFRGTDACTRKCIKVSFISFDQIEPSDIKVLFCSIK